MKGKRDICPTCGRSMSFGQPGNTKLAQALFAKRAGLRLDTRRAAIAAKVKHATYYRAERGRLPDPRNFYALVKWLGMTFEDMMPESPR